MNAKTASLPTVVAYFVTPHGFGHAARATAIMQALQAQNPELVLHIYTRVPERFFRDSLRQPFVYHECQTDLGLVQRSSLEVDLEASVTALQAFTPFDEARVAPLAQSLQNDGVQTVVCDIAPLGIAVANAAGLPSILTENFTWEWIYQPLVADAPDLAPVRHYYQSLTQQADYRIQTQPICELAESACLQVTPVAREFREAPEVVKARWALPLDKPLVFVTMGGVPEAVPFLSKLPQHPQYHFLITGVEAPYQKDNITAISNDMPVYTPDLIRAADAVVAKTGYSTLSEVWHAGVPILCVTREQFRESWPLQRFVEDDMGGLALCEDDYRVGGWLTDLPKLLTRRQTIDEKRTNGAQTVAEMILSVCTKD